MAVTICSAVCKTKTYSSIIQLVERSTVNREVTGSSPVGRACPDVDANFLLSRSHYLREMLLKGEHRFNR